MWQLWNFIALPNEAYLNLGFFWQNHKIPDTNGRYELLSMVKKQSKFLRDNDGQDSMSSGSSTMDPRFWHEMLDLYFMRRNVSKGHQEDDLVFFVRAKVGNWVCCFCLYNAWIMQQ
jgi:Uncharacterized conserved protein (DUF2045)